MPRYCLHIQLSAVKTFFFGHKNLAFAPSPPRLDGGLRTHADKRTQFPFAPSLPRRNWLLHRWPLHFRESSASASWRRPCRLCAGKWTDIRTALLTPHCWLWSRCPGKSRDPETPRVRHSPATELDAQSSRIPLGNKILASPFLKGYRETTQLTVIFAAREQGEWEMGMCSNKRDPSRHSPGSTQ